MSWLGTALSIVSTIGGSIISGSANSRAAEASAAATDRQTAAVTEGNRISQQQYEDMKRMSQPGVDYLRGVVAGNPNILSEGQQIRLDDARRQTIGSLSASGLRGAGRTVTAAVRDVEKRFGSDAYEANRNRQDRSAGMLSGPYFSAANNQAAGSAQAGRAGANIQSGAGAVQAEAITATGDQQASTLGALASFIADEEKAQGRDSKYGN